MAQRKKPKGRIKKGLAKGGGGASGSVMGVLLIVLCVGLIGGALWGSQFLAGKGRIDPETLCHAQGPSGVTVVLLDLTDPLSVTQQQRLRNHLDRDIAQAQTDRLFSVGVVNEDAQEWGALFARCKPATGKAANALYENAAIIADRYKAEFIQPLHAALERSLSVEEQNASPIMEALQFLVAQTPHFPDTTVDRKLIIVSDMLQHSETLSFYRNQGWDHFAKSNGQARLAGNLSNVAIEIFRIPRHGRNIPAAGLVEDFWVRYFDKQGSRIPTQSSLGDL